MSSYRIEDAGRRAEELKDEEILDLYWNRTESAITESQKSYGKYCYSIAFNILHDQMDSEECLNDTWMRAWNTIPPSRPSRLSLFLGTITRNLAFDVWKSKSAAKRGGGQTGEVLEELEECIPAKQTTEEVVEMHELQKTINTFLRGIAEKDCNVFIRRYYYAESLDQIAEKYGMKLATVKTSLFRTRTKLKEYLIKEGVNI